MIQFYDKYAFKKYMCISIEFISNILPDVNDFCTYLVSEKHKRKNDEKGKMFSKNCCQYNHNVLQMTHHGLYIYNRALLIQLPFIFQFPCLWLGFQRNGEERHKKQLLLKHKTLQTILRNYHKALINFNFKENLMLMNTYFTTNVASSEYLHVLYVG